MRSVLGANACSQLLIFLLGESGPPNSQKEVKGWAVALVTIDRTIFSLLALNDTIGAWRL